MTSTALMTTKATACLSCTRESCGMCLSDDNTNDISPSLCNMQLVHLLAGYVERGSTLSEEYRQLYNCGDAFIGTRMLDCRSGNIICIDEHNWHLVVADIIDKTRRLLVAR